LYVKYFDVNASAALSKQTENWGDYEVKPFWYYWSFFTQSGIWTIPSFIGLMYFYLRRRVTDVKAYTFSFIISSIGAYFGYYVKGGSFEIGRASTVAVIVSCILILFADYVLAALLL